MTLEEARARADAGEVSAMMALGNYYANEKALCRNQEQKGTAFNAANTTQKAEKTSQRAGA